ncbi:unnamed protein product [Peronospora belbahrii]|uniref:Uncharacterized protein n=1 Tax=Peronospora belbahrii TaxID=622444 RepID=A0AAU9KNQ3_9STRA|nr:unnamed protein product [Peronospora belbahrii]
MTSLSVSQTDLMPLVSARDASYWFAVASTPSSSRTGRISNAISTTTLSSLAFLFQYDMEGLDCIIIIK